MFSKGKDKPNLNAQLLHAEPPRSSPFIPIPDAHPAVRSSSTSSSTASDSTDSSLNDLETTIKSLSEWWTSYKKEVEINTELFQRGIVAIRILNSLPREVPQSVKDRSHSFRLGNRILYYASVGDPSVKERYQTFNASISGKKKKIRQKTFLKTRDLFNEIATLCRAVNFDTLVKPGFFLSEGHREEVFYPLIIAKSPQSFQETDFPEPLSQDNIKIGFYVYPWESKNFPSSSLSSLECHSIVTASCLFGSDIKGINQIGGKFSIIKHEKEFLPTEIIAQVIYSPQGDNVYESMQTAWFNELVQLIQKFARPNHPMTLYCHNPACDYLLLALRFFLRGRITLEALGQFFKIILEKKIEFTNRIQALCHKFSVNMAVESPFDNLFEGLMQKGTSITSVLETLGLSTEREDPERSPTELAEKENAWIEFCLAQLKDSAVDNTALNFVHKKVWQDVQKEGDLSIHTLEDLFRVGNAVMIARAAIHNNSEKNKSGFTISLYPLTEKQVQNSFENIFTQEKLSKQYTSVVHLTVLDPMVSVEPEDVDIKTSSKGIMFYYDSGQATTIAKLLNKKQMLDAAHANVAQYAQQDALIPLERVFSRK